MARARDYNRPQYIKIKAYAIQSAGNTAAAKSLFQRVIDEYPDSLDAPQCAEELGDVAMAAGEFGVAEARYRQSLEFRPDMNGTSHEVHIGLAEALVAQGRHEDALHALDYVPLSSLTLSHAHCRWNVALAEAALGVGEEHVAADAATRALALLDAPDQFARHPGVGRAALSADTISRLRKIAARQATEPPKKLGFFRRR